MAVLERSTFDTPPSPAGKAYKALRASLGAFGETQLFGYSGEIQNAMERECVEVLSRVEGWGGRSDVSDWELVLSVGDEEGWALGVMWALSGNLFIFNCRSATRQLNFERAWAIVQGT